MYAGSPTCQRGVAVIAEAKVAERVTEIDRFGDRMMVVKVKADPVDMVLFVCMYVCMLHFYSTICLKSFLIRILSASDGRTYVQSTHVKRCVFSFFLKLTTLSVL